MALKKIKPRKRQRPLRPIKPTTPVAPVTPVPVPIAPAADARAHAEDLVRHAKKLGVALAQSFYALGLTLRELAEPANFEALGYESFVDLVEERDLTNRMTAYRLINIVDAFAHPDAEKLGVDKGYAVIRYAEIARPGMKALAVLESDPVLRVRRGRSVRLSEASTRDIFEAIKNLRGRTDLPDAYVTRVQSATRGISQRLEHIDIRTARVRSIQRKDKMIVRVEIDGREAEKLLRVLGRR